MSAPRPYTCRACGARGEQPAHQGRPRSRCPPCAERHQAERVRANNARRYERARAQRLATA